MLDSVVQRWSDPRSGLALVLGSWLCLACAIDGRVLDEVESAPAASMGGSSSGAADAPPAPAAGTPGNGRSESNPVTMVPLVPLVGNGVACTSGGQCSSSRCEATPSGAQICCAEDCADGERCGQNGASCQALPRAQGEACGGALGCVSGLTCMPSAVGQSVCCASICASNEFCIDAGARCAAPLAALGAVCAESGECTSGYCDIDRLVCANNPCTGASSGAFCGRGAQCDAQSACTFTGAGLVAGGTAHTCAILTNGGVRCWGNNDEGGLGILPAQADVGDTIDELPALLPAISFADRRALQVVSGDNHNCALLDDGNVRCWGSNVDTQLVPAKPDGDVFLPAGERPVQLDAGGFHTCALFASGNLTCWGSNAQGQLGFGTSDVLANVQLGLVALPEPATQVAGGGAQTCAVLASGALNCWGNATVGALGYGSNARRFEPGDNVPVGASVLSASTGAGSTCVVTVGGFVRCWGRNPRGLLGYGHSDNIGVTETPEAAATLLSTTGVPLGGDVPLGGGGVVQVEVNSDSGHVCVRFSGGAVRCWGSNDGGSLGYGHELDIGDDETPADAARIGPDQIGGDVPFGRSVLALASGGRCAVLNDRSIVCWGRNTSGQIGIPALFPDGSLSQTPAALIAAGLGPISIE